MIKKYFLITLGAFLTAVGLNAFLVPFRLSPGGISSVGTVFLYLFKIPMSATNLIFNLILFVFGYKYLGRSSVSKTAFGIFALSFFLNFTEIISQYKNDILVGSLAGGILVGIGVGIVVRQGASTGGSDFAALILNKLIPHISVANFIMIIDCTIIFLTGTVFRSVTVMFYSAISLYLSGQMVDFITSFGDKAKSIYIISTYNSAIADEIMNNFERGVTGIYSRGMYRGTDMTMLLCVVIPKQLPNIVQTVKNIDENAFMIISDVREVLGEGF